MGTLIRTRAHRNATGPTLRPHPPPVHRYFVPDEVIPIRPRRGGLVHATALTSKRLNVTLCGRACHGWAVDEGPLTCPKCVSLSKLNKPLRQDPAGFYRTKTGKLADDLGWPRPLIYDQWRQLAMQVEYEARWSRALAELKAWELLEASLVKQGSEFAS